MKNNARSANRIQTSAGLLAMLAGGAISHAAIFTFTPTCPTLTWSNVCGTFNGCGAGNTLNRNNWGFQACNATPLFPAAADDVIFPVNGTIDATGVRSVTINAGAVVNYQANISTTNGLTNNGTVQTLAGNQTWGGTINNAGTWAEDGAGWLRFWNSVTFTNSGTMQFPGNVSLSNNSGINSMTNATGATIIKNGGSTGAFNSIAFTNSGAVVSNAGGAMNFNSLTFTSNATATYAASASGSINFGSCTIRGSFPMTLGADNLITFNNTTLGAPVTLNATGSAALLFGSMTASPANPLTNNGRINTAAGDQIRGGPFTNSIGATWTEDGAGWSRFFNSHSFTNAGQLNFPGGVNWTNNSGVNAFSNSGTVTKSSGGTMAMNSIPRTNTGTMRVLANGGTLQFNASSFASTGGANYIVTGPGSSIFWNGNTISGLFPITLSASGGATFTNSTTSGPTTINTSGGASIIGAGSMNTTGGLLTNTGLLAFAAGDLTWTGPWTNAATGVVTEDSSGWSRFFNTCAVSNVGTMNFPGSVNWTNNSGINSVLNTGTMNKTGGGQYLSTSIATFTNNGVIAVAPNGGNFQVSGSTYTGTGTVTIGAAGGMQLHSSTITGPINGTNSGGTFQSTGALTVGASGAQLNVTGSGFTLNGNKAGAGLLRNNNIANVTAGDKTLANDITNSVGAIWTEDAAGWSRSLNSHNFLNQGTLNLPGSTNWIDNSGTNSVLNTGTINKTAGGQFHANNLASVTNNGVIAIAASGGTFLMTSTVYSGTGTVNIGTSGNFQINSSTITGPINGTNMGGAFQSTGILTTGVGGAQLNVTGIGFTLNGNKAGAGLLRNNNIANVTAGDKTLGGPITNSAGASWTEDGSGWNRTLNSMIFTNNGSLNLPGSTNWTDNSGTNRIDNQAGGVVNKTAGGAFNINVNTTNAGLIDIQSGTYIATGGITQSASTGRVLVRSGGALSGATWNMLGGRLEGRGVVNQVFTNSGGTVAPGDSPSLNGTLSFANTYTQVAGGTYEVSLFGRPASPSDRIVSTNQMNLAGTLRVVITPPFLPKIGDVYEIARSNSNQRVGTFSNVVVVGPAAVTVSVSYTSSTALLTITGTECGSIDFNNDTSFFDPQDIEAFLSVFSEGPCIPANAICNDIDFNNDASLFDPCDINSFLTVFAEGPCTLCGQ